jgi:hypothetical protein
MIKLETMHKRVLIPLRDPIPHRSLEHHSAKLMTFCVGLSAFIAAWAIEAISAPRIILRTLSGFIPEVLRPSMTISPLVQCSGEK